MLVHLDKPIIELNHNFENNPWGNFYVELSPQILEFYEEKDFPFFIIVRSQVDNSVIWKEYLYPGTWAMWNFPSNRIAEVYTSNKFIKSLEWNQSIHGNTCEMMFYEWCSLNKGSIGISIGSHNGTWGEWVQPTQQGMVTTHCVEPSGKQFNELKNNFSQYRNISFSKHLVTISGSDTSFYEGGNGMLNTTNKDILNEYPEFSETKMESLSINDIFRKLTTKSPDFLHIDAEGLDIDLILSIDIKEMGLPKCIVYEHLSIEDEKEKKIYKWFNKNGYKYVRSCDNTIAILQEGIIPPEMNWGKLDTEVISALTEEIFIKKVYTKFVSVEKGDIVVDIGASAGPFVNSILKYEPSKIYCVEPIEVALDLCKENIGESINHKFLNYAIGRESGNYGVFNKEFHTDQIEFDKVSFMEFIESNNIYHIDFLKLDCESGEYDIFNEENIGWIKENVRKISGEWHLVQFIENFLHFRDTILPMFPNYKIFSIDGVDITHNLFTDMFNGNHYTEIIVSIDNTIS